MKQEEFIWPLLRSAFVWLLIVVAESINGTVRELLLVPVLGNMRAKQVSFLIALVLISLITYTFIKWIGASGFFHLLVIGGIWTVAMFSFELLLGRMVFGLSWETMAADYDVTRGGLMLFGMIYLTLVPRLAYTIRQSVSKAR